MKYYRYLYLGQGLERKKEKVIKKLKEKHFWPGLQLIVLSKGEGKHLEILNSSLLLQRDYPEKTYFVVGITKGFDEALEIVEEIVQEVYNETNGTDIRSYILNKEQEG